MRGSREDARALARHLLSATSSFKLKAEDGDKHGITQPGSVGQGGSSALGFLKSCQDKRDHRCWNSASLQKAVINGICFLLSKFLLTDLI